MIDNQREIKEVRHQIELLRRDFDTWKSAEAHAFGKRTQSATGERFTDRLEVAITERLRQQREFFRIERQVSAFEQHVTELERRYSANAPAR